MTAATKTKLNYAAIISTILGILIFLGGIINTYSSFQTRIVTIELKQITLEEKLTEIELKTKDNNEKTTAIYDIIVGNAGGSKPK